MKYVLTWFSGALCVSFGGRRHERFNGFARLSCNANHTAERLPKRRRHLPIESKGIQMNIRLISASAAAALGLALSTGAEARTIVVYAVPAVVYAPPPRPVYYAVPVQPTYVTVVRPAPVVVAPAPTVYVPAPKPAPVVYVPMQGSYAAVPAANVSYAQPVVAVPVAGMP
jgi:hypothetical protein